MRQLKGSASNIETRSPPSLVRCFPRSFTFYVADPAGSIVSRSLSLGSTRYPRGFTGHVVHPVAPLTLICCHSTL